MKRLFRIENEAGRGIVSDSCFAERLGQLVELTRSEIAALERIEERQREVKRGTLLQRENDEVSELFVLRHGWVISYMMLADGSRQILRLHFPGDFIGTASIVYEQAPSSLAAITDLVICPFDKRALRILYDEHPRLAALIFLITQAEHVSLTDRLASLGRTSAKARVGALLLDMRDRLRTMDKDIVDSFPLKLTQEEIGDAAGLTGVHVNRMMRALAEDGLIARSNGNVTIRDGEALAEASNYVNRFATLDLSWLPKAR